MPKRSAILDRRLKEELLGIVPIEPGEISEHALWKGAERLGLGSIKTLRKWLRELEQLGKVRSMEKGPYRRGNIPSLRLWQKFKGEGQESSFGAWPLPQSEAEKLLKAIGSLKPYGIGSGSAGVVTLADCDPDDPIIFSNIPLDEMRDKFIEAWRDSETEQDLADAIEEAWRNHLKSKRAPKEIEAIDYYEKTQSEYEELTYQEDAEKRGLSDQHMLPYDPATVSAEKRWRLFRSGVAVPPLASERAKLAEIEAKRKEIRPIIDAFEKEVKAHQPHLFLVTPRLEWLNLIQKPFNEELKEGKRKLAQILQSYEAEDLKALRNYTRELRRVIRKCERGQIRLPHPTLLGVNSFWDARQVAQFYKMQLSVIDKFLADQRQSDKAKVSSSH